VVRDGGPPALEFRGVTKSFPGQLAVDRVSFSVGRGEVHGLVGENGAGKSTLIKVLAGEYRADAGEILLDGRVVEINHPWEATLHGLGFIHQEPALVPRLSVQENVTLGYGYRRNRLGLIDWSRQEGVARQALARVGLRVDPAVRLEQLSVHERQLVAIARILLLEGRILVMDEVTAPLTEAEIQRLFSLIRQMRDGGVSVIYITHRLEEIFAIADRVTVLKNGRHVATEDVSGLTLRSLARLIVGKNPAGRFTRKLEGAGRATVLSVRGLSHGPLRDVSFDLREGEILGLAGLAGSGRTEILESIFGERGPVRGEICLAGELLNPRHPADTISRGVALVTEDRKRKAYVPRFPVWKNITLPWLRRFAHRGVLDLRKERDWAAEAMRRFDVRARSVDIPITELSGGNQQKAMLARWLSQPVRVLLLDEPTHGVDVGAKEDIYRIIQSIAARGTSVIIVSDELEELEGLCSRVLLLSEGRIVGELEGDEIEKPRMLTSLLVGDDHRRPS
jgi:ABC-type sugar transport system ATPase subunit